MKFIKILTLLIVLALNIQAADISKPSEFNPDIKSDHEIGHAKVIKAFSADDRGAKFRAYLVKWKDSEIIVSDPLGSSDKKRGDEITFIAQRVEMNMAGRDIKLLNFVLMDIKGPYFPVSEVSDKKAGSITAERKRFYKLGRQAKNAYNSGDYFAAKKYAEELASLAPKYKRDWNYGNAIQNSNLVLGRLALRDGDIKAAKEFLKKSAESKGSPQMNSFGPNLSLAKDLLEAGEKEAVIEYLNSCKKFWEMENGKLDRWIGIIKSGQTPDFGANLLY